MTELLAPAGNMEALRAAVSNGCDAVYLGLEKFGARAYSDNFTIDSLAEAIRYAHLRDVKIYVTMNTIVFEDEICDMRQQLDALNGIGVDGIIVQDLAVFDYVASNFADMEVHCSTQMGVDDLEGTMLLKEMGADRVVLAREVDLAEKNGLKVGDKIKVKSNLFDADNEKGANETVEAEIKGLFDGHNNAGVSAAQELYENTLITDISTAAKVYGNTEDTAVYQDATFFVKGDKNLDQVIKELGKLDINWREYNLVKST